MRPGLWERVKGDLRRSFLERRAALSQEERRRQSRAVLDRLRRLPPVRAAQTIAGYHPVGSELDDLEFIEECVGRGRRVALPRIDGVELSFHAWRPGDDLERNPVRILEPLRSAPAVPPAALDLVLVPGVAFDRRGHRLGYGKGFYDRLLKQVPLVARVGLAFDLQVVDALPDEPHDVPLGWVLTPGETLTNHGPQH